VWWGSTDEAVRRLGGDPCHCRPRTFDECFWAADGPQWAQIGAVNGGVLIAEHNGWRAEEAIQPLSRGARVACFFRNVHAVMHFVYAVDGTVVADFDPLLRRRPPVAAELGPAADGLDFGLFGAEASALSLLERLTGVSVRQSWLDAPQQAVALPAELSLMPVAVSADTGPHHRRRDEDRVAASRRIGRDLEEIGSGSCAR
jgi:hypothetical protein